MLGVDEKKLVEWREQEVREKTREACLRQLAQEAAAHAALVAPDNGRDISDIQARIGKPLTYQEFQDRVKKCNSSLHFEVAHADPSLAGVYLLKPEKKFICGMESSVMPEFTVVHKQKTKVFVMGLGWKEVETYAGETRGWRTVLVRLLHAKLISRAQVEQHFGWQPSQESENWWNQTDGSDPSIYG